MKKIIYVMIVLFAVQLTSCKKDVKKEETVKEKTVAFSVEKAVNTINFIAYKTTAKLAVKGAFTKVIITKNGKGNTIKEAINGAEFKIPVSSIETKDASRNTKIKQFFFGVMDNTILLTGKINVVDDKTGYIDFTMNGITKKLPFEYTIEAKKLAIKTTMNIDSWNAQNAVKSLNEACNELHKGLDGISKTWSDVAIEVTSVF